MNILKTTINNVIECYFPFVAKEFLRRNLFYVLETMPVKNSEWGQCYGTKIDNSRKKELLKLKKDAILFGSPNEMGITSDLNESIKNCFEIINLDKYIKIKKI